MSVVPADLKFAKTHEWVRVEEDGTVTVGISEHAQELVGDMVYVEVPEVGAEVDAEQACAVVESVKAASDVYSPITGEVIEVNEDLADSPEIVNNDSYEAGWIMRIRPDKLDDLDQLMDASAYEEFIASEAH